MIYRVLTILLVLQDFVAKPHYDDHYVCKTTYAWNYTHGSAQWEQCLPNSAASSGWVAACPSCFSCPSFGAGGFSGEGSKVVCDDGMMFWRFFRTRVPDVPGHGRKHKKAMRLTWMRTSNHIRLVGGPGENSQLEELFSQFSPYFSPIS